MMCLNKNKILILGANPETAVLVETAKKMGLYTIVTDYLPNSFAKRIADKAYDVDGLDVEGLTELAQQEEVDGIMVGTADPLIPSYYQVCSNLKLPCYATSAAVEAFTNKKKFKEVCKKFGIEGVPEYTMDEVLENQNVVYPILIKPSDGRSGKGMSVCFSPEEVQAAVKKALDSSRCKEFLIERYMECEDVFMYYTFADGKFYLSAMADRFTSKEQKGVDPVVLGGIYPSKYIDLYKLQLHEKMCEMFRYLNIRNGVLLIQAFVENGHFYVYDPGFRLQGGAPHILINAINGFDHREMLLHFALTGEMGADKVEKNNDSSFRGKIGASQVVLLRAGIIARIEGIETVKKFKEVVAVTQRLFEGDEVNMIGTEQQVLVRFHLVCDTKEELYQVVDSINHAIHVFDMEGNEMCLNGLRTEWMKE